MSTPPPPPGDRSNDPYGPPPPESENGGSSSAQQYGDQQQYGSQQYGEQPPPPPGGGYPQYGAGQPQGYPQYGGQGGYGGYGEAPSQARNGFGWAALVLGIVGLLTSWIFIGGALGILAIIFGILGLKRSRRREATNAWAAITGLVTGIIAVLVAAFFILVVAIFADEFGSYSECVSNATTSQERADCDRQFEDDLNNRGNS